MALSSLQDEPLLSASCGSRHAPCTVLEGDRGAAQSLSGGFEPAHPLPCQRIATSGCISDGGQTAYFKGARTTIAQDACDIMLQAACRTGNLHPVASRRRHELGTVLRATRRILQAAWSQWIRVSVQILSVLHVSVTAINQHASLVETLPLHSMPLTNGSKHLA